VICTRVLPQRLTSYAASNSSDGYCPKPRGRRTLGPHSPRSRVITAARRSRPARPDPTDTGASGARPLSSAWMPHFSACPCAAVRPRGCAYAIKVGYWSWLPLKSWRPSAGHWHALAPDVTAWSIGSSSAVAAAPTGDDLPQARPAREPQELPTRPLHLDDGHFDTYAVATNLPLSLPALYASIGGRGAQEKTIAELKGEFALDVVPTRHYGPTVPGSNSASSPNNHRP